MAGPYGELIETTVRIATWNVWWRFGPWEVRQPAIEATLAALDADIVCLQETWEDQAARLAARLGYHHVQAARLELEPGVGFGNAVLSRWPIASHEVAPLPSPPALEEGRLCLRADIDGERGPLQVFTTHLHWRFDHGHVRQDQVREICRLVAGSPERSFPPVLCGDLNAPHDSDEIRMLTGRAAVPEPRLVFHDAWEVAGHGPGVTWSNENPYAVLDLEPDRRIDYVLAGWPKPGGRGHVLAADRFGIEPVDGVVGSDHYGVVATLRY